MGGVANEDRAVQTRLHQTVVSLASVSVSFPDATLRDVSLSKLCFRIFVPAENWNIGQFILWHRFLKGSILFPVSF